MNILLLAGSRKYIRADQVMSGFALGIGALGAVELQPAPTLNIDKLIGGAAAGVDSFVPQLAEIFGLPYEEFPAAWSDLTVPDALVRYRDGRPYNARAGFARNLVMANLATMAILIWNGESRGTAHMWTLLQERAIPTYIYNPETLNGVLHP